MSKRVYLYDSTLRDGSQARGVDFTLADKRAIAERLDAFGIDYIEGGWPGANPNDDAFFEDLPDVGQAKISAFGMTRRAGRSAANDPGLAAMADNAAPVICMVGKTWDFHVDKALQVKREENLKMIGDSIRHLVARGKELHFDAEHFFDGYKENQEYALACVKEAYDAGARWVVLCDTNGGTMPQEVDEIVRAVIEHIPGDHLGIHCHNDTEQAVANSLAAVQAGVRQVQGTLNGVGERCGNANLVSIIPTLMLKMGFETGVKPEKLKELTGLYYFLDERLNRPSDTHAAYVGAAAFAHKGGLHVSAMARDSRSYEHIDPALVGNQRQILVSDKAGKANVVERLQQFNIHLTEESDDQLSALVKEIKIREKQGYAYEQADASFELLARRFLGSVPDYFRMHSFRVLDERRWNAKGKLVTLSEATAKVEIGDELVMTVAEGNGPVNALDSALRKALAPVFPAVQELRLVDYKVRILTPEAGTEAVTRVMIESSDGDGKRWMTIGVSANIIDASYNALRDSLTYKLFTDELIG